MEYDQDTAFYHTWFREYDPGQGRWLSVDPLPGHEADPQTYNRYVYVRNDPVNLRDPLGLDTCFGYHVWLETELGDGGGTERTYIGFIPVYCWDETGGDSRDADSQAGSDNRRMFAVINHEVLAKCIDLLFGFTMTSFVPAERGGKLGSFEGYRTSEGTGNPGSDVLILTNANRTSADLYKEDLKKGGEPVPPGQTILGVTWPDNPYVNYVARDNLAVSTHNRAIVHELGNSLGHISGRQQFPLFPSPPGTDRDPGAYLEDCARRGGRPF
jgi:RHS repeat-associated protein